MWWAWDEAVVGCRWVSWDEVGWAGAAGMMAVPLARPLFEPWESVECGIPIAVSFVHPTRVDLEGSPLVSASHHPFIRSSREETLTEREVHPR